MMNHSNICQSKCSNRNLDMYLKIAALKPVMEKYRKAWGISKQKHVEKEKSNKSLLKTNENL